MPARAKEFIDFWVENSIHAKESFGLPGSSQDPSLLVQRLIAAAQAQGLSEADLVSEVGDLRAYLETKLSQANADETARRKS